MAVTFDAKASATGFTATTTTLTFAHTCGASATLLVVAVGIGAGSGDGGCSITGVTYNGVALTAGGAIVHENAGTAGFIQEWYLENPTTGSSQNVVITRAGGAGTVDLLGNAISYNGAGAPTGRVTNSGNGLTTLTVSPNAAVGEMAAAHFGNGAAFSGVGNQTVRFTQNVNVNSAGGNNGYSDMDGVGSASAITMNVTSDWYASIGFVIPAGGAGPDPGYGYLEQEDGVSRFTLEDASGFLLLDTASAAPIPPIIVLPPRST